MDTNTKMKTEKVLNYTKNIALSSAVLFTGLFIIPVIGVIIFLKMADPIIFHSIVVLAPIPMDNWFTQLAMTFFVIAPSIAFIVWVIRDSRKFVAQGVNTRPFLWGIGMIFPLILVVFPLYFIRRNITWVKEKQEIILANRHKKGLASWLSVSNLVTENTKIGIKKVWNVLKWAGVVLVLSFVVLMISRIPHVLEKQKTDEQVAKIHATKLTMDDVVGKNLPPDPGVEVDKTVAGVDANTNGIRDDVELAIFKEYPDSAKTRAVLLQYALALQMEAVQPFENGGTVGAVDEENSRGYLCIGKILSREDITKYIKDGNDLRGFVEEQQLNTDARKNFQKRFYEHLNSGEVPSKNVCDIDLTSLSN